ncbi:MAG: glycosyltransferase, partial [bacterium]
MKILIDGRGIKKTGIGRYIENTLSEVLKLDNVNTYILLVKSSDKKNINISAANLSYVVADADWFGLKEQTELLKVINKQQPDLVHFTNFNFPVAYKGRFVITIHDLTLLHFKNLKPSPMYRAYYLFKEQIMKNVVLKRGITKAQAIFVPSEYVKEDVAKTFKVRRNKI